MKKQLVFIVLLVWLYYDGSAQAALKLPVPDQAIIKDNSADDKGFLYLETYFKKDGEKKTLELFTDCKENCVCSWEQPFEKGIIYKQSSCQETGLSVTITFLNYSSNEIVKLVSTLFKTSRNEWNKEKTEYKSKEPEPGCYYQVSKEKAAVTLKYHCGC